MNKFQRLHLDLLTNYDRVVKFLDSPEPGLLLISGDYQGVVDTILNYITEHIVIPYSLTLTLNEMIIPNNKLVYIEAGEQSILHLRTGLSVLNKCLVSVQSTDLDGVDCVVIPERDKVETFYIWTARECNAKLNINNLVSKFSTPKIDSTHCDQTLTPLLLNNPNINNEL
jgi:hypothetical protein